MIDLFLFRFALKDLVRLKRLMPIVLLAALPLVLALAWRAIATGQKPEPADLYDHLSEGFIFGFLLEILACVFATRVISQEVEQKTIVYLLTRPVPRWRILLMKYLAATVATTVAGWAALLLLQLGTYGVTGWNHSRLGHDLLILPVACLAYSALFLLLATLFQRPLLIGLIYAFGLETWMPALPGKFKQLSLLTYVRTLAPHGDPPPPPDPTNPFATVLTDNVTPNFAWGVIIAVTIIGLIAALMVFSTKEYVPREDS